MRSLVLLATLGCAAPTAPPSPDTLLEVSALLEQVTDEGAAAHRAAFAPEISPASFPAEAHRGARFTHLRRLRQIGRALVAEAVVQAEGRSLAVEVWLEPHEGGWRITGWDPDVRAVEGGAALGVARLPLVFAGRTIRGGLAPASVADPRVAPLDDQPVKPVVVRVHVAEGAVGCGPDLRRLARGLEGRLRECYQARFPDGGRQGRLTLSRGGGGAALVEATLVDEALGQCARDVVDDLGGEGCRAELRVTFSGPPR